MVYFTRGMYRTYNGNVTRGLYETASVVDPNIILTPFLRISDGAPHKFIDGNGDCFILFGIKAPRSLVIDELMLNYFKLFSIQKD
jgi:hypothetical protein